MTYVRLGFYVLYVVLGAIIVLRLGALGVRGQTISGLVLGAALIALGLYRLFGYFKAAEQRK